MQKVTRIMHLHNDYAKFMQSDYAKFRQIVVPLPLGLPVSIKRVRLSILTVCLLIPGLDVLRC